MGYRRDLGRDANNSEVDLEFDGAYRFDARNHSDMGIFGGGLTEFLDDVDNKLLNLDGPNDGWMKDNGAYDNGPDDENLREVA